MKMNKEVPVARVDDPESIVLVLDDWKECEEPEEACIPPEIDERYDLNQLKSLLTAIPVSLSYSDVSGGGYFPKTIPNKKSLPTGSNRSQKSSTAKPKTLSKTRPTKYAAKMFKTTNQEEFKILTPSPLQSLTSLQARKTEARDLSTPIMVLHDIFRSQVEWQLFSSELAHTLGKRVISVDLRNHGTSPIVSPNCGLAENLIDLRNLLKELKFAQSTVTMIGHGLSGWILLVYCLLFPYKARNLIVIEASPNDNPKFAKDLAHVKTTLNLLQAPRKGKPLRTVRYDIGQNLEEHISSTKLRSFIIQNLVVEKIIGRPDKWEGRRSDLINSLLSFTKFPDCLKLFTFEKPTLFIASTASPNLKAEDEEEIRQWFPQADFVYLKTTSSHPHIDEYGNLISIVSEFIKRVESQETKKN